MDAAIAVTGRGARRSDGKLPPHVRVYFVMAMALLADDDYEEVAARLTDTLTSWRCWDTEWSVPTSGGITQARRRLGSEPVRELFSRVAVPAADGLTRGAWLWHRRLMAIDGFEWDVPDSAANVAEFGRSGSGGNASAFPKVRVVAVSECGSHAVVDAEIGGVATGEQSLAGPLLERLDPDWLLLADRGFFSFGAWRAAAATGAQLLWRVKSDLRLPVLGGMLPDGSYPSVLIASNIRGRAREALLRAAAEGRDLDPAEAVPVRVVEYEVPDRAGDDGELICLITTFTDFRDAPAQALAETYHQRREIEIGNNQLKTHLREPGRVLRSKSPDLVRQEIYGYLLTHYAISALICEAATEAEIDPDRIKFVRTVRLIRRHVADPAAFPPDLLKRSLADVKSQITAKRNLNPHRRDRSYPRVVKRARHNQYKVKKPDDVGVRHTGPPTIELVNRQPLDLAA